MASAVAVHGAARSVLSVLSELLARGRPLRLLLVPLPRLARRAPIRQRHRVDHGAKRALGSGGVGAVGRSSSGGGPGGAAEDLGGGLGRRCLLLLLARARVHHARLRCVHRRRLMPHVGVDLA